jgi:hypothetical protein
MPITIRQAISQIQTDLKSTMDTRIAPRAIWNKYVFNLASILKQVNETKRVWKSSDVWQKIKCLNMEVVSAATCPEIAPLVKEYIAKSIDKIPATYTGNAGDMIRDLNSIFPYGKQYVIVTPKEYKAIRQREFQDKSIGYAFVIDNYLYIPDSEIEKVTLTGAFINPREVALLNGGDPCKPFLDYQFYCPEYLVGPVHDMVVKDLAGVNQKIVKDEDADLNENTRGQNPQK